MSGYQFAKGMVLAERLYYEGVKPALETLLGKSLHRFLAPRHHRLPEKEGAQ